MNPTAAAIGTLKTIHRLVPEQHQSTIDFLADMQSDEGGLAANTRIPFDRMDMKLPVSSSHPKLVTQPDPLSSLDKFSDLASSIQLFSRSKLFSFLIFFNELTSRM